MLNFFLFLKDLEILFFYLKEILSFKKINFSSASFHVDINWGCEHLRILRGFIFVIAECVLL